jgi:hypothetical protein
MKKRPLDLGNQFEDRLFSRHSEMDRLQSAYANLQDFCSTTRDRCYNHRFLASTYSAYTYVVHILDRFEKWRHLVFFARKFVMQIMMLTWSASFAVFYFTVRSILLSISTTLNKKMIRKIGQNIVKT